MPKHLYLSLPFPATIGKLPQDGPAEMKALAEQLGWRFPYCLDDSQDLAKAFQQHVRLIFMSLVKIKNCLTAVN